MKVKEWCNYLVNTEEISMVNIKPKDLRGIAVYFTGGCHIYMLDETSQNYYGLNALDSFKKYVLGEGDKPARTPRG